jgi:hypothetical protein
MWIVFSILFVLWLVGIEKYVPPVLSFFFFFAMIATAAFALWPMGERTTVERDRG